MVAAADSFFWWNRKEVRGVRSLLLTLRMQRRILKHTIAQATAIATVKTLSVLALSLTFEFLTVFAPTIIEGIQSKEWENGWDRWWYLSELDFWCRPVPFASWLLDFGSLLLVIIEGIYVEQENEKGWDNWGISKRAEFWMSTCTFCLYCPVEIDGVDVWMKPNECLAITVGNGCESSLTSEGTERMREREKWCVLDIILYLPMKERHGTQQAWAANVGNGKVGESSPSSNLQFHRLQQFCDVLVCSNRCSEIQGKISTITHTVNRCGRYHIRDTRVPKTRWQPCPACNKIWKPLLCHTVFINMLRMFTIR
jgi:hypothetical protein